VIAGLADGRGAHALEAASGAGHVSPPAGDPVRVHVPAHALVEFPVCLLPATLDEAAEQRTCPAAQIYALRF
jgi:hypothetical protein